jgi:hypothetical protein
MKLYTPENTELMEVTSIEPHSEGLLVHGRIMNAMPMQAVLRAPDLRLSLRLLSLRVLTRLLVMLVLGIPRR